MATAGVDVVMGLGDVVQRVTVADGDGEGADGGGEVAGGLALGLAWEVVAAEQPQGDVVEQQRPEGDLGAVRAGGVGGDDGVVGGDGVVEIGVVGQRDFDDPVDAPWRVRADGRGGVASVQGDGVGDDGRVDVVEVRGAADGGDYGGAGPVGELGGQRADAAEDSVDQDQSAGDRAVGEDGAVGGDAGDAQARPQLVAEVVGQRYGG